MKCPLCGSELLKTLPYVRELGTYSVWQSDPGGGTSLNATDKVSETFYTRLAEAACPPRLASLATTATTFVAGVVVLICGVQFGAAAYVPGVLIIAYALWRGVRNVRHNRGPYRQAYAQWQQSFICVDCGHIVAPDARQP